MTNTMIVFVILICIYINVMWLINFFNNDEQEIFDEVETKMYPSREDSDFEMEKKYGEASIKMKSYTDFTRCKYCGSKNTNSDSNCIKCGGPI